jgi:transmembrane sensor
MHTDRIKQLASAYLLGSATEEEKQELHNWYDETVDQEEEQVIIDTGETSDEIRQRILATLLQNTVASTPTEPAKVLAVFKKSWLRIAAVLVLILMGTATWLILPRSSKTEQAGNQSAVTNSTTDVMPGKTKALLTLANGDKIVLDSVAFGKLAQQGNTAVLNENGQLIYTAGSQQESHPVYNTLTTARGEVYPLVLSDGSKVWLNAASSIYFPVAFTGKKRIVEITGEAYFEVAKNKTMPFIVRVNGAEIQVLGTQFNVMAYNDEATVNTTLLEGSVKFEKNGNSIFLRPGEQSQLNLTGKIRVVNDVNIKKVMAWKNGFFDFEGSDFETIANQLSRWYDVEVKYEKKIDEQFYAEIPRNTKLSVVLKALELTGKVDFKIEGRNIIVIP